MDPYYTQSSAGRHHDSKTMTPVKKTLGLLYSYLLVVRIQMEAVWERMGVGL